MISPQKRRIASKAQLRDVIVAWIFPVIWCSMTFTAFYMTAIRFESLFGAAISGFMSLLGIVMLWAALKMTMERMKFGNIALTPQRSPMRIGETVLANVEFADAAPASSELIAELKCQLVTWTRDSRGKVAESEETNWSQRRAFKIVNTGSGMSAALSFDIPPDAHPTDLPSEHSGESRWTSVSVATAAGSTQQYYRWEILLSAEVPGLDLNRVFKVIVEPGSKSTVRGDATLHPVPLTDSARSSKPGALAPTRNLKWVMPAIFVLITGSFFFDSFKRWWDPAAISQPIAEIVKVNQWQTQTGGWTLPMPTQVRYLGIAAEHIKLNAKAGKLQWRIDRVAFEKPPSTGDITIESMEVMLQVAKGSSRKNMSTSGVGEILNVGATLTAAEPAVTINNVSTPEVDATFCADGKCSVFLTVKLKLPGAATAVQESRKLNVF